MKTKQWRGFVFKTTLLFFAVLGVFAWAQMKEANPKWTEEFRVDDSDKKEIVRLVDELAEKYSLSRQYLDGPSQLENRKVYFFHYKFDDQIVMTLHDLKGRGDRLTLYYYGLHRVDGDGLEKDLKAIFSNYEQSGTDPN